MDRLAFIANAVAKAKQVMDKVETGNYTKGHIDAEFVAGDKKAPDTKRPAQMMEQQYAQPQIGYQQPVQQPTKSPLPAAIMESFAKNPGNSAMMGAIDTSNPLAMNNFQMDQMAKVVKQQTASQGLTQAQRQALEEQFNPTNTYDAGGVQPAAPSFSQQLKSQPQQMYAPTPQPQYIQPTMAPQGLSEDYVKFLINQTIQETVKATVEAVMEQLNKPATIDENIQIRIGGKTFGGKIKTLKS